MSVRRKSATDEVWEMNESSCLNSVTNCWNFRIPKLEVLGLRRGSLEVDGTGSIVDGVFYFWIWEREWWRI